MRNISKILAVVAAIAVVAIVATIMKLGNGNGNSTVGTQTDGERTAQNPEVEGSSTSTTKQIVRVTSQPIQPRLAAVVARATNGDSMPLKATPDLIADWDEKVNDILGAEGDEKEKAKKLIEMFPHLPADG